MPTNPLCSYYRAVTEQRGNGEKLDGLLSFLISFKYVTVYKLTLLPFIHGECKHAYFLYTLDVNCQDKEMLTPSTTSHVSGECQCSLFISG